MDVAAVGNSEEALETVIGGDELKLAEVVTLPSDSAQLWRSGDTV